MTLAELANIVFMTNVIGRKLNIWHNGGATEKVIEPPDQDLPQVASISPAHFIQIKLLVFVIIPQTVAITQHLLRVGGNWYA